MSKRPQLNVADPENELRDKIEDLRARRRPVPSQSEMVRVLVREAWERECGAAAKKGKR